MILIFGLGNPGKKYAKTRHNIGARIVSQLTINSKNVLLIKPSSFMNESGKITKALNKKYPLKDNTLIIVHDDLDLPLGQIKIVKNRGSAGHKGVESIVQELKTKDFIRLRIGISPQNKIKNPKEYVLKNFNKGEEKIIKKIITQSKAIIEYFLENDLEKTMNQFNKENIEN